MRDLKNVKISRRMRYQSFYVLHIPDGHMLSRRKSNESMIRVSILLFDLAGYFIYFGDFEMSKMAAPPIAKSVSLPNKEMGWLFFHRLSFLLLETFVKESLGILIYLFVPREGVAEICKLEHLLPK